MRLYYQENGDVFTYSMDSDPRSKFTMPNVPYYVVDEVGTEATNNNVGLIADIISNVHAFDALGRRKYYVENGKLFSRDDWTIAI